jgi:hypothetical protein
MCYGLIPVVDYFEEESMIFHFYTGDMPYVTA